MATPGMRAMDLEVRLADGEPAPFLNAAVQGVLFYVSWLFPPLLLVTFITPDKRCLHDILADVIVLRRALERAISTRKILGAARASILISRSARAGRRRSVRYIEFGDRTRRA